MSEARAAMLAAIRANRPKGDYPLPALPAFAQPTPGGLADCFAARLAVMGGSALRVSRADPLAPLRAELERSARVWCFEPEWTGNVARDWTPFELARTDIAIVRARAGVAETGSVLLTEAELGVNAIAYLAEHLVVLLDAAAILPDLPSLYRRGDLLAANYAVLHTGPSATADIEGVMILGAQGVRSLRVLIMDHPSC